MLAGERDIVYAYVRVWHFARNGKEDRSKKEKEIGNNEYFFLEECNMARNNFLLLERRRERERKRETERVGWRSRNLTNFQ